MSLHQPPWLSLRAQLLGRSGSLLAIDVMTISDKTNWRFPICKKTTTPTMSSMTLGKALSLAAAWWHWHAPKLILSISVIFYCLTVKTIRKPKLGSCPPVRTLQKPMSAYGWSFTNSSLACVLFRVSVLWQQKDQEKNRATRSTWCVPKCSNIQ